MRNPEVRRPATPGERVPGLADMYAEAMGMLSPYLADDSAVRMWLSIGRDVSSMALSEDRLTVGMRLANRFDSPRAMFEALRCGASVFAAEAWRFGGPSGLYEREASGLAAAQASSLPWTWMDPDEWLMSKV